MVTEIDIVTLRQNLGEMLDRVEHRRDSVVINKNGRPVAALVDARLFERVRRMQGRFDALCQRIEVGFAGVPECEGLSQIDEAVRMERARAGRGANKG
jgi:prevent-host-death family protein